LPLAKQMNPSVPFCGEERMEKNMNKNRAIDL
jgi:hypothetical protein